MNQNTGGEGRMYELALFAGAGGGILGGMLCGHTCIGACEIEEYPREVLEQRQRDGILPQFPIWDDICTFRSDNPECSEYFDFLRSIAGELVISGGFPCQDISAAGKGAGIGGSRSGLWGEMARIIGEVRPARAFVENSPLLVQRGLAVVLGDLAEMGYDARWCVLGADDAGAPHRRKRIWIMAYSDLQHGERWAKSQQPAGNSRESWNQSVRGGIGGEDMAHAGETGLQRSKQPGTLRSERNWQTAHGSVAERSCSWWHTDPAEVADTESIRINREHGDNTGETRSDGARALKHDSSRKCNGRESRPTQPRLGVLADELARGLDGAGAPFGGTVPRVAQNVPNRVNRLKAIGNGQVPLTVALAWQTLTLDTSSNTPDIQASER